MADEALVPVSQSQAVQPAGETPLVADKVEQTDDVDKLNEDIAKTLKDRYKSCERKKQTSLTSEWKRSVELRMGRPFGKVYGDLLVDEDDTLQTSANPDWSLTKTKTASLFSQVPSVQGTHENKQYAGAIPPFLKQLNYELGEKRCNTGTAMEECLNDIVNASGVGGVYISWSATFQNKRMPKEAQILIPNPQTGQPVPIPTAKLTNDQMDRLEKAGLLHTEVVPAVVSAKFNTDRLSPSDLLWPTEHTSMDWDKADFLGYRGRCGWAEGVREFKLTDDQKERVIKAVVGKRDGDLRVQEGEDPEKGLEQMEFRRLFYWRHRFDPDELYFDALWEIVYVEGLDKPVKHEPYGGQQFDEQTGQYIGVRRFPIRICTITYITDNPIPPSDSAAARPHVLDMIRSRSQMFLNRDRSMPARWYDVNRIDNEIGLQLQRSGPQGWIPTNGAGDKALGEVARASYPAEDFTFDQMNSADMRDVYQIDAQQQGLMTGKMTSAQQQALLQTRATRGGQERAQVAKFFLSICDVLAGLMVLHSDFSILTDQERQQMMQIWDAKHVIHDVVLKIRPDSQVVIESGYRAQKITNFLNMTVKSGFVNPLPLIVELAELNDIDPTDVIVQPQPKPPEEPALAYRFNGDDMQKPAVVAMLAKRNELPSPEHLKAAKKFLLATQDSPDQEPPEATAHGGTGAAGAPHPPGAPAGPVEGAPHGEAHPGWQLGSRVAKRSRDVSGG